MKATNTNKKTSARKKLLPAAGSLLISAAMLGTSTYAWFTMNRTVTVDGMEVRTKVGSNLLISTANADDSTYTTDITQSIKALLEPASTVDGLNYWYTVEANAAGDKLPSGTYHKYDEATGSGSTIANAVAAKTGYDYNFNSTYRNGPTFSSGPALSGDYDGAAYAYVDYTFYLKATTDATDHVINMTECNLKFNGTEVDGSSGTTGTDKNAAWRVAVFAVKTAKETETATPAADGNLKSILTLDGADNWTDDKAVGGTSTPSISDVTYNGKATIATISGDNTTEYYKVIVRLWLEGEDETCNSQTYAKLTKDYSLDLKFELEANDDNAVQYINQ